MEVGALQCFAGYYHIGMVPDVENIHRVKLIPARNLVFSQCIRERDTSLMSWDFH